MHRSAFLPAPARRRAQQPSAVAQWLGNLSQTRVSAPGSGQDAAEAAAAAEPAHALAHSGAGAAAVSPHASLVHQRLTVRPSRYVAPQLLHLQPGQLVGLIFTLLGPPNFKPAVPGLRHPQSEGERSAGRLHPAYPTLLS